MTTLYEHEIKMINTESFIKKSFNIPFALRAKVEKTIQGMINLNIIRREASPYSSPLTVVKKMDGSVLVCLDARELNDRMVADCESPPPLQELLQRFGYYNCYWQISLHP